MVYAVNDLSIERHATVNGAVISKNLIDTTASSIDSTFSGTPTISFNCANAKNRRRLDPDRLVRQTGKLSGAVELMRTWRAGG